MLRIVAHDLKNPLSAVIGFTTLIKEATSKSGENNIYKFATQIYLAANNMNNLINDFLVSAINDATDFDLHLSIFSISDCVRNVIFSLENQIQSKSQKIIQHNSVDNFYTNSDLNKFTEVIENIISNAITYSDFGKTITVNIFNNNHSVIVGITDEGPGFSSEDKEKVFGKFQKLSAKPTGNETSTGLGLHISKRIIDRLGGDIWFDTVLGNGSTFYISVPEYVAYSNIEKEMIRP